MPVAITRPLPADTKLPDITCAPISLSTGSASPVSSDSSTSSPMAETTSPSTTIWLPEEMSMMSSATISSAAISCVSPSRTTAAFGAFKMASCSSARLARTSWTIPMMLLESTTPTNKASRGDRATKISTNRLSMMAFTGVKTLARTISPNDRTGEGGAALVRPSARRFFTSAEVRPDSGSTLIGALAVSDIHLLYAGVRQASRNQLDEPARDEPARDVSKSCRLASKHEQLQHRSQ